MSAVKTTCSAGEKRKVAFIRDSVNDAIGQPVPSPDDWVCWRGRARSERNRGVVTAIEPRAFARLARRNGQSPLVKNLVASLGGRNLVIGVDRLDYSKGLIQRLDAFDIFLANHTSGLAS
jgi:hypothetical protein